MNFTKREDIVISGVSGRYPESDSVDEFSDNLYNHIDMVTDDERRFPKMFNGCPMSTGKLKNVGKFDANFFTVTDWEADYMDAQIRAMLETTYEAIADSGTVPEALSGTNTGVFIGICVNEELHACRDAPQLPAYKNFMSQTVANKFNLKGPTLSADTYCNSSFIALNEAYLAIKYGRCDAALCIGVNIAFNPNSYYNFFRLNMISPDSKCMCLDERANGYAKGEAVVTVFLQRRSRARRVYATIVNIVTNNDGYKSEGITFPSWHRQRAVIARTYAECRIDPTRVDYVEAHCTGTKAGDPVEMRAIYYAIAATDAREKPLLIGALKSNTGHTEGASGLCAVTKVILAFENELIPANLHFNRANPAIESLIEGHIQPINENTVFSGDLVGLNNFGFGGSNTHLILRSPKIRAQAGNDHIVGHRYPRLVHVCGRSEGAVNYFFGKLFEKPTKISRDLLHLINELSKSSPHETGTGCRPMRYRGFTLIGANSSVQTGLTFTPIQVNKVAKTRRQLCFLFPGIGSQFDKQLMSFDVIADSVHKSAIVLRDKGVDLLALLTNVRPNAESNDWTLNTMLSSVAIQMALTDQLRHLGLAADHMIGYSIGEMVCAYADDCLTARETLLVAYYCGKFIDKMSAKKGLNITFNGPNATNIGHCLGEYYDEVLTTGRDTNPYIETLVRKLDSVIGCDRQKSSKWITNTNDYNCNYINGKYFVDCLLLPAMLNNRLTNCVPNGSVIVDLCSYTLLANESMSLNSNYTYIPLMKRMDDNCESLLLTGLGRLYTHGFNVSIETLYPAVGGPVSTGTRMLSPFIQWNHTKSYREIKFPEYFNFFQSRSSESYTIDFTDVNDQYILDHCIDGTVLFPGTGYLMLAWRSLAFHKQISYKEFAVEFRDVQLLRVTPVTADRKVTFTVNVDRSTHRFHIIESGSIVVSGTVREITGDQPLRYTSVLNEIQAMADTSDETPIWLQSKDVYKVLRTRGYNYGPSFRCITDAHEIHDTYLSAGIEWRQNWVTFCDCLLQTCNLMTRSKQLLVPVAIDELRCDPKRLFGGSGVERRTVINPHLNIAVTAGLEMRGVRTSALHRNVKSQKPALRRYEFAAFDECSAINTITDTISGGQSIGDINMDLQKQILNESQLDKDMWCLSCGERNFLRSQLTIFAENLNELSGNRVNIVEVNAGSAPMYGTVMSAIDILQYSLDVNFVFIGSTIGFKEEDKNLYSNTYTLNDSRLGCDVNDNSIDLIVYKDQSLCNLTANETQNVDINALFLSFWQRLTDCGFVLIVLKSQLSCCAAKHTRNQLALKPYDQMASSADETVMNAVNSVGFRLVSRNTDSCSVHSLLYRKIISEPSIERQIFIEFTNNYNKWLHSFQHEFSSIGDKPVDQSIWLVANGSAEGLLGFIKCVRTEPNGHRVRALQIMDTNNADCIVLDKTNTMLNDVIKNNLAINVLRDGKVGHYVLNELPERRQTVDSEHCFLNQQNRGDLSSFQWFECQHKYWPLNRKSGEKLVNIYYSALNFRDIMLATGRLQLTAPDGETECLIGSEFAGRDENRNRVMGMVLSKALATTCVVKKTHFLWPIPDHWSMEEAATVPCVYGTAYYALIIRGKLRPNETVLIHSGSGGVGQAAIRICLSLGCRLLITVGSDAKRRFLRELFPTLGAQCFSTSRDATAFRRHVMTETDGAGVDVVLNSLSDEKLFASLECLATNGRFLEIGKYDFVKDSLLNVTDLLRNKTFEGIQFDALLMVDDKTSPTMLRDRQRVWELINAGIGAGVVRPLNRTVYEHNRCEQAFRFMASGQHVGKVMVKIRDEEPVKHTLHLNAIKIAAIPRTVFLSHKTYIMTGGLGGMGLEIIDWMVERGAQRFVVTSRSGPKQPYQYSRLKYFKDTGVDIFVWTQPIGGERDANDLFVEAMKLGPIGGIFHLSLVISDCLLENQSIESFDKVFESKSKPLAHLDHMSRQMCPQLDHFVVFSSAVTSQGSAGQSNYGFTNAAMERLCERRHRDGLPALAVQWGPVGDVGYMADNITANDWEMGAMRAQRMHSCLQTLDELLESGVTICSSVLFRAEKTRKTCDSATDGHNLLTTVCRILGHKDLEAFDATTRLSELGMDSLLTVETKHAIERDFELVLSTQEIRNLTIERIRQISLCKN